MASTVDMAAAARQERPLSFLQELERAARIDRARSVLRELERQLVVTPAASYRILEVVKGRGTLADIAICQDLEEIMSYCGMRAQAAAKH